MHFIFAESGETTMTAKELIEYLSGFDPESNVSALILDLKQRLAYPGGEGTS